MHFAGTSRQRKRAEGVCSKDAFTAKRALPCQAGLGEGRICFYAQLGIFLSSHNDEVGKSVLIDAAPFFSSADAVWIRSRFCSYERKRFASGDDMISPAALRGIRLIFCASYGYTRLLYSNFSSPRHFFYLRRSSKMMADGIFGVNSFSVRFWAIGCIVVVLKVLLAVNSLLPHGRPSVSTHRMKTSNCVSFFTSYAGLPVVIPEHEAPYLGMGICHIVASE